MGAEAPPSTFPLPPCPTQPLPHHTQNSIVVWIIFTLFNFLTQQLGFMGNPQKINEENQCDFSPVLCYICLHP